MTLIKQRGIINIAISGRIHTNSSLHPALLGAAVGAVNNFTRYKIHDERLK